MESTSTTEIVTPTPPLFDDTKLEVSRFLACYSGSTRSGYAADLRAWFAWCAQVGLEVFGVRRPTSSSTPGGWRRNDTSVGPPSVDDCRQ